MPSPALPSWGSENLRYNVFSSSYHRSLRSRVRERKFTVKTRLLGCNFPQLHEKKNFVDQWREAILAKEEASAAVAAASAFYDAPLVRPRLAIVVQRIIRYPNIRGYPALFRLSGFDRDSAFWYPAVSAIRPIIRGSHNWGKYGQITPKKGFK